MITSAPRPSIQKWFIKNNSREYKTLSPWVRKGEKELFFSKSWMSIKCIIEWIRKKRDTSNICIYVPDYFCNDTQKCFADCNLDIVTYHITQDLNPNLQECRKMAHDKRPDIFLLVHYFGKPSSIVADIRLFCDHYQAIMIEDATHVLYPVKGVGEYGTFTLYSPWKLLGIPDGAVLILGKKQREEIEELYTEILQVKRKLENNINEPSVLIWKIKQPIITIIPNWFVRIRNKQKHLVYDNQFMKISGYSYNYLHQISLNELMKIGVKRQRNARHFLYLLNELYGISSYFEGDLFDEYTPYLASIRIDKYSVTKESILSKINIIGLIANSWPDLSERILKDQDSLAPHIYKNTIMVALHQGIREQSICRIRQYNIKDNNTDSINISRISEQEYKSISKNAMLNLLQSPEYGYAKRETQNWRYSFWKILYNENIVASFLMLEKKLCIYVRRINRGPIWIDSSLTDEKKEKIICAIKNKFSNWNSILFIAPNIGASGYNINSLASKGFHCIYENSYTGFINLQQDIVDIRNSFKAKWRNQLKKAESQKDYTYSTSLSDFETLLVLHEKEKKERKYSDSGRKITKALFKAGNLRIFSARNCKGEVCSFVMIAVHGNMGTYYIGWNNEEGYKNNLNKLLLWKAMIGLKEDNIQWFDLGGIDSINTPGVAEFKLGTGCEKIEYVGDYILFPRIK